MDAYVKRGLVRISLGQAALAREAFLLALARDAAHVVATKCLGDLAMSAKNYTEAINQFSKAIELGPEPALLVKIHQARAYAKHLSGDQEGAIVDCTAAITTQPDFAPAYLTRAQAKEKLNDVDGAIEDLEAAVRLGIPHAQEWANHAGLLRRAKSLIFNRRLILSKPGENAGFAVVEFGPQGTIEVVASGASLQRWRVVSQSRWFRDGVSYGFQVNGVLPTDSNYRIEAGGHFDLTANASFRGSVTFTTTQGGFENRVATGRLVRLQPVPAAPGQGQSTGPAVSPDLPPDLAAPLDEEKADEELRRIREGENR